MYSVLDMSITRHFTVNRSFLEHLHFYSTCFLFLVVLGNKTSHRGGPTSLSRTVGVSNVIVIVKFKKHFTCAAQSHRPINETARAVPIALVYIRSLPLTDAKLRTYKVVLPPARDNLQKWTNRTRDIYQIPLLER
jgi:hypothetical protein